ncbi:MAG: D-alanyl-D-alanine carboxypeptidase [Gammaproteobacteria bacterium]|nr:D-alanyl-D-alanine carboxypeptidase [Gammaproteobacteria bacterium]
MKKTILIFSTLILLSVNCIANTNLNEKIIKQLNGGSAILQDVSGEIIFSHNADKYMVPASILKIATADSALSHLGKDFRIKTEFYLTKDNYLAIKGYGDPSLVSEELALIAKQLKQIISEKTLDNVKGFWLDTSFFKPHLKVHGQSSSNNPYDSSIGALVANFNTLHVVKTKKGKVTSAESQTPLTPTAIQLTKKLSPGKHRINLGKQESLTLQYFTELMHEFLKKEGINIPVKIVHKAIPENSELLMVHQSKPLSDIIKDLLRYSNNFTANQLLVILGGHKKGIPADLNKGKEVVIEFLENTVGLNHFTLEEGSGLSRKNQFTANQIMIILNHFKPYQNLLRIDQQHFQAKTGTLKGISTYAGYILSPSGDSFPFVIMINKSKWGSIRKKVANLLYQMIL